MVTIEQIRLHCRIDSDDEDSLLEHYRAAAYEALNAHTSRNWYGAADDIPAADTDGIRLNSAANQAVLLLIGSWYANREADRESTEIPAAYWHLIQPYRIYGV